MRSSTRFALLFFTVLFSAALSAQSTRAADYPAPQEGSWVVRDFRFHTGEVLPELRLHYRTVGAPTRDKADQLLNARLAAPFPADDERNPPEVGVLDRESRRVKNGRMLLVPGSDQTAGHGTTAQAKFWKKELGELLQSAPKMAP